jgi:cyanophycinase-like exopeptidase
MKLYLFGGAEIELNHAPRLKQLINEVLSEIKPKQLLHIPYARSKVSEREVDIFGEGWVKRDLNLEGIELLDARKEEDLQKAKNPVVFINGGHQKELLYKRITENRLLYKLVMNASVIIGESSGAAVCGEYRRTDIDGKDILTKGLGIIKDTIIEGHYTQRNRQQLLKDEVKELDAKYGIGIDSVTGIVIDTKSFPEKYEVIGDGKVEIIT